ncbi:MAG: toll/interleukin-1 receptor domain-containing protein [Verrucomicrobiota bacterium]
MLKVFISYSSKDRQVVKWIDRELDERGFKSRMDVEFLEGGDDFAEEIRDRIANCDEMILVLSPNSLQSQWVTYEAACADMLGKRIVPVLLCVEPEAVPSLLQKYHARPINQIDLLANAMMRRAEAKERGESDGVTMSEDEYAEIEAAEDFSPGTDVRLPMAPPPTVIRPAGHLIRWRGEMDQYFGQTANVVEVNQPSQAVRLDVDGGEFWWAIEWMTREA